MPAIISKAVLVTNIQRHISFNPLRLEMGLERQIQKYLLHFFSSRYNDYFQWDLCGGPHLYSQHSGAGKGGQQSQPGLHSKTRPHPTECLYSHFTAITLSLKFPLDHKVAATQNKLLIDGILPSYCQCLCYLFLCIIWTWNWVSVSSEHGSRYGKASTTVFLTKLEY